MNKRDFEDICSAVTVGIAFFATLGIGISLLLTIIAITLYGLKTLGATP